MSNAVNITNNELSKDQKGLIYGALTSHVIRFQEYNLPHECIKPDGAALFEYLCLNSYYRYVKEVTSEGYFYHSYEKIKEEYGIGKDRVQKITGFLKKIGILETSVRGYPKNTHYRIRFDKLGETDAVEQLFRVQPKRLKEIAEHFACIAKSIGPAAPDPREALIKQYPDEWRIAKRFTETYYAEKKRFNKHTVEEGWIKKLLPKPREETLKNLREFLELSVLAFIDEKSETEAVIEEKKQNRFKAVMDGFRLYCAAYFYYTSKKPPTGADLKSIIKRIESYDMVDMANLAGGIRDPLAYFLAPGKRIRNRAPDANFLPFDYVEMYAKCRKEGLLEYFVQSAEIR